MLWQSSKANPILSETTDCIQSTDYLHTKPDLLANSPFQRWRYRRIASWGIFSRPCGTARLAHANPGLTSWATLSRPYGTEFGEGSSHTPCKPNSSKCDSFRDAEAGGRKCRSSLDHQSGARAPSCRPWSRHLLNRGPVELSMRGVR
jgi:hypothetical protein